MLYPAAISDQTVQARLGRTGLLRHRGRRALTKLLHGLTTVPRTLTCGYLAVMIASATSVAANGAPPTQQVRKDLFRVELPLPRADYQNAQLSLKSLITEETFIDVSQYHLHGVEVVATTANHGAVRLQVGRFITPPHSPPNSATAEGRAIAAAPADKPTTPGPASETGLDANAAAALYITAPHKSQKEWQLVFEEQVSIHQLTAILEPQASALAVLNTRRPANADPAFGLDGLSRTDRFDQNPFDRRARSPFFRDPSDPFSRGFRDHRDSRFRRRDNRADPWRSRSINNLAHAVRLRRAQERAQERTQAQAEARQRAIERAQQLDRDTSAGGRSVQPAPSRGSPNQGRAGTQTRNHREGTAAQHR